MDAAPVLKDDASQRAINRPVIVDKNARLVSINIQYFIIIILLILFAVGCFIYAMQQSERADNNIKVAWVKMYPNGTWDIEFHDKNRKIEFFQSTIDYLLTQWVERRYSEIPHSIGADYGFVHIFMNPKLRNNFVSTKGFNAAEKAAKVSDCISCQEIRYKVRSIDHYDSDKTKFGSHDGTLYRTNIFVQKIIKNADGTQAHAPQKKIVSIQWRIKSVKEIQGDKKLLKQNPIGLEIVRYDLLNDVSN